MDHLKRREFIRNTFLAGAGISLTIPELTNARQDQISRAQPSVSIQSPSSQKKVIVAGAGISGLCCAYELMKAGHDVVILEAPLDPRRQHLELDPVRHLADAQLLVEHVLADAVPPRQPLAIRVAVERVEVLREGLDVVRVGEEAFARSAACRCGARSPPISRSGYSG